MGTQGGEIDFALLVDGLAAEREQGITIDVAYRFFSTDKRKFIVADTPATSNTPATWSPAPRRPTRHPDGRCAQGHPHQTRRHSYLVNLIGIRHIVVAINKMDLVDYAEGVFRRIVEDYTAFSPPARHRAGDLHPDVGVRGRQHHLSERCDALVPRHHADGLPRDGGGR